MLQDGQSFESVLNVAMNFHNFEVAEILKSKYGQTTYSLADSFHFGNFDFVADLINKGANVNEIYEIFL